jgi:formylglycine-generating enzyme required for sulfatase activity
LIGIQDTTDEPPLGPRDASRDDGVGIADSSRDGADGEVDGGDPCPRTHGPQMVRLAAGFCIDSTEVTRGDYAAFMASDAGLATGSQPPQCSFNTTFAPSGWPYPADADTAIPVGANWCDALAYCAWAGKRLCGARSDGGVTTTAQGSDPAFSEWMAACSRGGTRTFPYGSSYQPTACNGKDLDAGRTLPVATKPLCQGGDDGLYDMSGNAWEWDMSCVLDDAGRPKQCGQRGGSFADNSGLLGCALTNYQNITLIEESSGFRCCAN